jgi:hypothetical protein
MNKKTIIKYVVGAVVLYAAYQFLFCGSKCDAAEVAKTWQIDAEVGQYEKRIDTGLYTGDDANYLKLATDLGVVGGLSLVGDLEYVDTDATQLYATVGTVLDTPIGALGVSGQYTNIEGDDNLFEVGASYGLNLFGLDAVLGVVASEESEYSAELATELDVYENELIVVSVGGAYGQTFETADDYDYTLGYARISTTGTLGLFATFNYLNSDSAAGTNGEWESTTDIGVALSF